MSEIKWIPIVTRPFTKEEKQEILERADCSAIDLEWPEGFRYDCPLPDDGEEVLVTTKRGFVIVLEFARDGDLVYFGEDGPDEPDTLKAWAHLPKAYDESEDLGGAEWIQETVETEYGKFPKLLCSSCRNPRAQIPMNYCGNCGEKMKNPDATIKGETTYEK